MNEPLLISVCKDYEQALLVIRNTDNMTVPSELLNNVAVLNQLQMDSLKTETGQSPSEAIRDMYAQALKNSAESGKSSDEIEASQLTIKFNIANFYEHIGEKEKAEHLYLELIKKYPAYVDSLLRLAIMRFRDEKYDETIKMASEVTQIEPEDTRAWLILGNAYFAKKDVREARKKYEHVMMKIDRHDSFALCALGNLQIWYLRHDTKSPNVCFPFDY